MPSGAGSADGLRRPSLIARTSSSNVAHACTCCEDGCVFSGDASSIPHARRAGVRSPVSSSARSTRSAVARTSITRASNAPAHRARASIRRLTALARCSMHCASNVNAGLSSARPSARRLATVQAFARSSSMSRRWCE